MNPMISTILFLAQQTAGSTTSPEPDLLQTLLPFLFMGVLFYGPSLSGVANSLVALEEFWPAEPVI